MSSARRPSALATALLCAAAAVPIWTGALVAGRYYGLSLQFPLGLLVEYLALGLPAFFLAAALGRLRVWQPVVWVAVAYLLADGADQAARTLDVDLARRGLIWVVRVISLGTAQPAADGGFIFGWTSLLSLVIVIFVAQYGVESVRGHRRSQ